MKIELGGRYGYRRMVKSSIPAVMMIMVSSLYSIVDGIFVSNCTGTTAFAALNLVWPALMVVGAIGLMFGTGGSAMVAMIIGQGDRERANRVFTMLIRTLIITAVTLSVLLFLFIRPVSYWLGSDEEMIDLCVIYGRILLVAMPMYMLQLAFGPLYMAAEKPQIGTWVTILCGIANILFDALFILVFKWGLAGAAAATGLAQALGGIFPLVYFSSRKFNTTGLRFVKTRTDWRSIFHACSNGLSEYVTNISLSVVGICYNLQLMRLIGEDGVAVYGILIYLGYVYASFFIGFNITVSPIVSYNYGAQNHTELKSLLRNSITILLAVGTMLTILSELLSNVMSGVFVSYDPQLKELTGHAIRLYMISFILYGFNLFVSAWFTALNNGIVSAIAAFVRTLVFELGSIFVLPLFWGLDGVWLAVDMADLLDLFVSVILLKAFQKRYNY